MTLPSQDPIAMGQQRSTIATGHALHVDAPQGAPAAPPPPAPKRRRKASEVAAAAVDSDVSADAALPAIVTGHALR